jgi:hypothetical protein
MGKTVRRKRKSRIKKRKTRVKKRRSRIKKRKAHFKRRRTRVKKRKFINKKTRRKKRRTIQKGGLGFKDLIMALSLLTASLSGASKTMLPTRTERMLDQLKPDAEVCSNSNWKSLFRDAAPGLHTDRVNYETDEERSTAAFHMTAVNEIAGKLKNEQKKISDGTCSLLINIIGEDDMQKLTEAKKFIIEHHVKGDNTQKKESDGDGNKSDDSETTDSNLPLIGLATTTLGGLQLWGEYKKNEEEKEKEEIAQKKPVLEATTAPAQGHITGIGSYYD